MTHIKLRFLGAFALLLITSVAIAQPNQATLEAAVGIEKEETFVLFDEPTHPEIKLSPDKSKLLRLDQKVDKVIVGNPNHLAVLPSDKNTIVLIGRMPGATYFTALSGSGEIIMQRHVLVAAPQNNYVRIRRTCAVSELDNCQETQMFYCPDSCHNVALTTQADEDEGDQGAAGPSGGNGDNIPAPNEADPVSD